MKCDDCRWRIFCPYKGVADAEVMAHCIRYIPPDMTCKLEPVPTEFDGEEVAAVGIECTCCGLLEEDVIGIDPDNWMYWRYCPNCGAKVVKND